MPLPIRSAKILLYELNPRHRLESGLILGLEPGQVTGTFSRIPDEGEVDYDIRFEERVPLDEYVRGQRIEGYLQDRYTVLPFLSVVFGLRLDYFNRIDELSIQPRGSVLVELPNSSGTPICLRNLQPNPAACALISQRREPGFKVQSRKSLYSRT